eukprot:scaffold258_cov354-Prasinococcus_capsulatus_cf.AAC.5
MGVAIVEEGGGQVAVECLGVPASVDGGLKVLCSSTEVRLRESLHTLRLRQLGDTCQRLTGCHGWEDAPV